MTKLDLIDAFPEIYSKNNVRNLTKDEIEQLRIMIVGNKKLYGSRTARLPKPNKLQEIDEMEEHEARKSPKKKLSPRKLRLDSESSGDMYSEA
jgi:hypothetical protein